MEDPDASGQLSTSKSWRGCRESVEDDWSVACVCHGRGEIFEGRISPKCLTSGQPSISIVDAV